MTSAILRAQESVDPLHTVVLGIRASARHRTGMRVCALVSLPRDEAALSLTGPHLGGARNSTPPGTATLWGPSGQPLAMTPPRGASLYRNSPQSISASNFPKPQGPRCPSCVLTLWSLRPGAAQARGALRPGIPHPLGNREHGQSCAELGGCLQRVPAHR